MQPSTRAFIKRGGAVCAAAAVFIGGTFTAGAATASPSQDIEPSSISTAAATATAASTAPASEAALPEGLAEAVERDLDMSPEEFNKRGALALEAGKIQKALSEVDPKAVVSLDGDTVKVTTTEPAAAESAAGEIKISTETPAPAPSTDVSDEVAPVPADSVDTLLTDYIAEYKDASNLQSIMLNAAGEFVIRTGEPATAGPGMARRSAPAKTTPLDEFANKYGNVKIELATGPATPYVDAVNGQGYLIDGNFACSIGWNGFTSTGAPAVISAGHCTGDGTANETELSNPLTDPAEGGPGGEGVGALGTFGFSQFGGTNNAPVTGDLNGPISGIGNIGTDVSVIDGIDEAIDQFAIVTDWTTPADPKANGPQVTGVSEAIIGAPICKSGRTTGWSCSTVDGTGVFLVGGTGGGGVANARAVRGFGSAGLLADQGDSGGSIIAGNVAVGMISAGVPAEGEQPAGPTYGVSLLDALSYTEGYSIKLFLNTPTINTTSAVYRGGAFTGTVPGAPAGTTVEVTINGTPASAPVAADGTWSVPAPSEFATYTVTAKAKNGFNESETTTDSVAVIKQTLPAPAITAPANAGTVGAPVNAINGTGTAGATVAVEIADGNDDTDDITGTAVVGADGNWSVAVNPGLAVGNYTATAQQTQADWNDSPTATSTFAVVYAAPAIVSPANGAEFAFNAGPAEISGTNVDGAAVVVTVNGTSYNAVVTGTAWTVALNAPLTSGAYALTAVQSLNGVSSLVAESTFTVLAAPAPAPVEMDLANTGTSGTTVLLAIAGGLVLLGGAAFLLIRRRGTN